MKGDFPGNRQSTPTCHDGGGSHGPLRSSRADPRDPGLRRANGISKFGPADGADDSRLQGKRPRRVREGRLRLQRGRRVLPQEVGERQEEVRLDLRRRRSQGFQAALPVLRPRDSSRSADDEEAASLRRGQDGRRRLRRQGTAAGNVFGEARGESRHHRGDQRGQQLHVRVHADPALPPGVRSPQEHPHHHLQPTKGSAAASLNDSLSFFFFHPP